MDFPHLRRDTNFPNLQTVDVYAFQNTFDYTRWNEFTKVRLVNVIWNSNYADVVKFDTNAARDEYFDSIEDYYVIDLEQACRVVPDGIIKLPVPYDVIARYNYLYIDMPIATDAQHPLDFETIDGIRRWYFFIEDISYRAPNTTEVRLVPDIWTNFQNDVEINYMMLERGHAPVAFSDVDEYLADPINNNEYLLAPDVNFSSDTVVRDSEFMPFNNDEKWLVLFSTIAPDQISSIGSVTGATTDSWTNPTYSNTADRFGYQLQVNGYNFGDAGDYSGLSVPVGNGSRDRLPNGVFAYATAAKYCFGASGTVMRGMMSKIPNFLRSVIAAVVVSKDMLVFTSDLITISDYHFYLCAGANSYVNTLDLTKDMFGFPEEYQRFAKLYTYPYSSIELTDNDGRKVDVKIENTGTIQAHMLTSLAFPFINQRVYFTGINGVGSDTYTWERIDGVSATKRIDNGDWFENCFDWDIPTYAIYMSGKIAYNLGNYNSLQNARREALVGYHTSVRSANTAMQNAIDAANTAYTNVDASATTLVTNMANTINTQIANNNATTACNTANTNSANSHSQTIMSNNNGQLTDDNASTNNCIDSTTVVENQTSIACAASTNLASVQSGGISGGIGSIGIAGAALAAGIPGGAIPSIIGMGAMLGAASSQIGASANGTNAKLVAQCNSVVAGATKSANTWHAVHAEVANAANQYEMNADRSAQTANTNACLNTQTTNTTNCERTNTNNDAATMRANADRTRDTSNDNSGYTREVGILNAKEILENAQARARARYTDSGNSAPVQIGSYTGSMAPDYYETRGIQMKVRTESDGAIRQAGDMFARYGYALNQVWNVAASGLTLMEHFTYWKCSDIWVDDRQSSNNAVNRAIESMFINGVTVWSDPDEIGRVSIYAN